jgi:hypothetical protein
VKSGKATDPGRPPSTRCSPTSALPNVTDTFTTGFRKIAGFPKLDIIDQRLKTNGDVDISIAPLEGRQRRRQSVQSGLERRH